MWFRALARAVSALLTMGVGTPLVLALLPPLSHEELHEQSECIVEADVIGVALTAIERDASWEHHCYRAWLLVRSSHKGNLAPDTTFEVAWNDKRWRSTDPEPPRGSFEPAYYPGDRVRTCLVWSKSRSAWITVHWNGQDVIVQGGQPLPTQVGQIVLGLDQSCPQ